MITKEINELKLSFMDGFREMTEDEIKQLNFYKDGPGVCVKDPQRHILITVGWNKTTFGTLMISAKEAAQNAESKISKPMQANGYQLDSFYERKLGGEKACGYRYHYTAQDIKMTGETWVVKRNKSFYYLNFYARTELEADSLEIWNQILDTADFH